MSLETYSEEHNLKLIKKIIQLVDVFQWLLSLDEEIPACPDYEELSSEEVELSLAQILAFFRQTLRQLQETPPKVQQTAFDILFSYFIQLQGLYDLISGTRYESDSHILDPSCAVPDVDDLHESYFSPPQELESNPIIQEYRSIPYQDLMNISLSHHLHVVLFVLLPRLVFVPIKAFFQRKPCCQKILEPDEVDTVEALQELLAKVPLTQAAKLSIALRRHMMRIADILFTRIVLLWGRPILELLVLATWIQTVKDHIIPEIPKLNWDAKHLVIKQTEEQEVPEINGCSEKIKMPGLLFIQPRITFRLKRFLIFKNRTMTVGKIIRPTEFGNWMRQHSADEFWQFFNIALGDMGGLGVRVIPEHEVVDTKDTLWLYTALMSFVPGSMTSPGSIMMRNANYNLTKAEQLLCEILYYDPRFKGSSGFINDMKTIMKSILVLNKGKAQRGQQDKA